MSNEITGKKSELEKLYQEHKIIFENTSNALFYVSVEGDRTFRYLRVNRRCQVLTGIAQDKWIGKTPYELYDRETADFIQANYEKCCLEKSEMAYEETINFPAGKKTYYTILSPVLEDGKVVRIVGSAYDISENKAKQDVLKQSEQKFRKIVENLNDIIFTVNPQGDYTYVSPNWKHWLGYDPDEVVGKNTAEFVKPEYLEHMAAAREEVLKRGVMVEENIYRIRHRNGQWRWFASRLTLITGEDGEPLILGVARDITEQKQTDMIMQSRLTIMEYARDHALEAVLQKIVDEICDISDSLVGFFHFVGDDEDTLMLKAWSTRTYEKFCHVGDKRGMSYTAEKAGVWTDALHQRRPVIHNDYSALPHRKGLPEGHPHLTRQLVVPVIRQQKVVALLGVGNKPQAYIQDDVKMVNNFADLAWEIVERKRSEEKIRYLSLHDALTGLYNRAFVEEEIRRLDTSRQIPISLIMADLNGLKIVNDTYEHAVGDELLINAAQLLKDSCRQEDILARWGGDEFVILLPQTSEKEARKICRRIDENSHQYRVRELPLSLAMGVGVKKDPGEKLMDTLQAAESHMYKNKIAESQYVSNNIMHSLITSLERKSFEAKQHTKRMTKVALKMGEHIGLPETERNRLKKLIAIHDIGYIHLPADVLMKAYPLTETEWKKIKQHPETGYKIARATDDFSHLAEDVFAHHERWDGKGYPRGIKGDNIPLLARITAIVDAYEVMQSGRPYKKAMDQEEIFAELKRCSGTQFDPELVDILLSLPDAHS